MGTNYYIHKNVCEHCGRGDEPLHVGKSSAGWCFALHVTDEIKTLDDWKLIIENPENLIKDEYGETVTPAEMLRVVTDRRFDRKQKPSVFYESWSEFHDQNHSQDGPNGLMRHRLDNNHCLGHGEGTWDLITGEFS